MEHICRLNALLGVVGSARICLNVNRIPSPPPPLLEALAGEQTTNYSKGNDDGDDDNIDLCASKAFGSLVRVSQWPVIADDALGVGCNETHMAARTMKRLVRGRLCDARKVLETACGSNSHGEGTIEVIDDFGVLQIVQR
jgi:hypothetical protein